MVYDTHRSCLSAHYEHERGARIASLFFKAVSGVMKMTLHNISEILVVDDSGAVRGVVRKLLTQLGFKNIDEASDGEAALAKISEKNFGLVISDWNMEPMSGQVLLEKVRENKQHANLPFIMMTADSTIDKIVQAKNAGVTSFIKKPFRAEELQVKISQTNTNNRLIASAL
jgi:two-component system chemotaxis response regulator CheY